MNSFKSQNTKMSCNEPKLKYGNSHEKIKNKTNNQIGTATSKEDYSFDNGCATSKENYDFDSQNSDSANSNN